MIIDYREKELIEQLQEEQVKPLPIGDVWIGLIQDQEEPQEGSILIERKTVADFEASFLDGRYREQRTRLISYAAEKKANILYVLEGDLTTAKRLKPEALQQLLNRLQLRYKIALINTTSVEHTAVVCSLLQKQWQEDNKAFIYESVGYEQTIHVQKKANLSDPKFIYLAMIQQIPGVSKAVAEALYGSYPKLGELLKASKETLAQIVVGKRKLGPKLAEKMCGIFETMN